MIFEKLIYQENEILNFLKIFQLFLMKKLIINLINIDKIINLI